MQLLGQNYWGGVCGFVSVVHGILLSSSDSNALDGLSKNELEYNLGLSVLEFLRYAKVSKPEVATEMVNFTRAFGGAHARACRRMIDWLLSLLLGGCLKPSVDFAQKCRKRGSRAGRLGSPLPGVLVTAILVLAVGSAAAAWPAAALCWAVIKGRH